MSDNPEVPPPLPPVMPVPAPTKPTSLPWAAITARCSWVAFLVVLGVSFVAGTARAIPTLGILADLLSLLATVCGLTCGIAALFGLRPFGWRGILIPASIGILLNGLMLFAIMIPNFLQARRQERDLRRQEVGWVTVREEERVRGNRIQYPMT